MRRHVRCLAGSWLVLQLLVTVCVPVALFAATASESADHECTCDHPDGGICPMHRHSTGKPQSPSTGCALRGAMDPLDALVTSMMGPAGVLPSLVTTIASIETSDRPAHSAPTPLNRLTPPDSPPPRG